MSKLLRKFSLSRSFFLLPTLLALIMGASLVLTGCGGNNTDTPGPGKTTSDAELIKAQEACPITRKKLGSMGKPIKITLKSQPVFLCCDSCKDEALANPDKTLNKLKELKDKRKGGDE